MSFLESLRQHRLLAILRGVEIGELELVAKACTLAGLRFVEITLNTEDALTKIEKLQRLSGGAFQVGAGTVLSSAQAHDAVAAGAQFIVAPVLDLDVARAASDLGVPYIPGALTPKEVWDAYRASATIVKVFPIRCYGPSYIQELRGPFGDIPLLGCGGICKDNLLEYLGAGADALALGASTFRRDWLAKGNLTALQTALDEIVGCVRSHEAKSA